MYTNTILAVSGALLSVVAAVPMAGEHAHHQQHHQHHQRDYVWETATEEVVVTVPVTKTVWIEPGETPPSHGHKPHGYGHHGKPSSSDIEPAAYTPASSSSAPAAPAYTPDVNSSSTPEAPAYTPPTSTSTSVYVAPTPSTSTSIYVAPTPTTLTSAYVAPTPTTSTSVYVAPTPTSTYVAPSSSSVAAAAAPSYSSGGSSSGSDGLSGMAASGTKYTGDLTWYDVGLGACGLTSTPSQHIVAVSEKIFDAYDNGNPNNNPLCGKWITITGKDGSSYEAQIVDRCPGCAEPDLDLSQDFFNKCTDNGDGRVSGMTWSFN